MSASRPVQTGPLTPYFCYSFHVVFTHVEVHDHPTQSQDATHPPQPLRRHFRGGPSFHPRRFAQVLAGLGFHRHLVSPHADYLGLFPEARSPAGRAQAAHRGKDQRAENHHSLGTSGCFCVRGDSRIGLPFRLVSRPAVADDSFPTRRFRRLSDHPLGHEREQLCLSHCPSRRRPESYLHGTLPVRPPSHVLRRCSHAALYALCPGLLVGPPFPRRYPFDRPPPSQRRKNALPRPPRLFRLLPPHPLPPAPPSLVTPITHNFSSFGGFDNASYFRNVFLSARFAWQHKMERPKWRG